MAPAARHAPRQSFRRRWRIRVRDWALRRQGTDALPLRLRARRLYILPTRAGLAFAALAAVTFIAGMNYGSGLAMLLCFWLAGFLLTAMLQTHRVLAGTQLLACQAQPAFAGGEVGLELRLQGAGNSELLLQEPDSGQSVHAASCARDETRIRLDIPVPRRGHWQAPPLELSTRSPFGLFRCWTWLNLEAATDVYPSPEGTRPPPESPGEQAGQASAATGLDELTWLRPFREGDSPRQVAWKAYARGTPLLVREYRGASGSRHELHFDLLTGLDTEQRLSQLARWVVDAAARHEHYCLLLPGHRPLHGSDAAHRERCLVALARF